MGQDFLPLVPPRGLSASPGCSLPSWQLPPNSWGLDPGWFPAPRIHPLSPAVPWLVTALCPEPHGDPWPTHRGIWPWGLGHRAAGLGDIPSAQGTPGCGAHNHECPTALLGGTGTLRGDRPHAGQWGHNRPGSWHHISPPAKVAWHSVARSGTARHGVARSAMARHGTAQISTAPGMGTMERGCATTSPRLAVTRCQGRNGDNWRCSTRQHHIPHHLPSPLPCRHPVPPQPAPTATPHTSPSRGHPPHPRLTPGALRRGR